MVYFLGSVAGVNELCVAPWTARLMLAVIFTCPLLVFVVTELFNLACFLDVS